MDRKTIIAESLNYIENNIKNKITIEEIAGNIGYTKFYFSRLFTNYLKLSPTQYRENKNRTIYFRTTVQTSHHIMAV